jgi:hypothetical protein
MKFARLLSRLALLSLAAAVFAVLAGIYGHSVRPPLPDPQWRAERGHRRSAPEVRRLPALVGEGLIVAIYDWTDRISIAAFPYVS